MTQQAIAFSGELDEEDGSFECIVDRFIYKNSGVSFQFSCFDSEGGAHTATGTAEKDSLGRYVTTEFRVRYDSDRVDTPASFRLESIDYDHTTPSLTVAASWAQAGDTFALTGRLSPFKR